jgi:hypothetical protein
MRTEMKRETKPSARCMYWQGKKIWDLCLCVRIGEPGSMVPSAFWRRKMHRFEGDTLVKLSSNDLRNEACVCE